MRLGELWDRVVDRVMPDRYRDERWADQARAQWERGEPPVGEVETMWYGLFDQEKTDAAEAELDRLMDEAAEKFPEYSALDKEQEAVYEAARERGPNMSYPEYGGPGFTEPAINDPGLHEDHSEYERDHYWDEPGKSTDEMSDKEINALALPFEDAEPPENEPDEPPVQVADPTMLAVERSIPEGPERDAFAADRQAGTLKTCDDRAAETDDWMHPHVVDPAQADAAQFEKFYGEPPTPAAEEREAPAEATPGERDMPQAQPESAAPEPASAGPEREGCG